MNRRELLQAGWGLAGCGVGVLAALNPAQGAQQRPSRARAFTMDLCPGRIGVDVDQRQAIQLARRFGFESVEPMAAHLARLGTEELEQLRAELQEASLVWGAAGLPVDFRSDEATFQQDLRQLPTLAAALRQAGVTRVGTWLSPGSDELTYMANFRQHVRRLKEVVNILASHDLRFGLEYVGPKTSWTSRRFPFVHTLVEARELIDALASDQLGLVLDSWHWYTAGETVADLQSLGNREIVAVDLNDAPQGLERDEQIDNRRELPLATGVIDLAGFLRALHALGYDGPIRAEPFNRSLNQLPDEAAVRTTAAAMQRAFALLEAP